MVHFHQYGLASDLLPPKQIAPFQLILQAFWGLATMLFLVFGAWLSTPASGSGFLSAVSSELRDEDGAWAFFAGVERSGWVSFACTAACFAPHIMPVIGLQKLLEMTGGIIMIWLYTKHHVGLMHVDAPDAHYS